MIPFARRAYGRITSPPRAAPFLAVVALFGTFSLVGVWHGQTSEFPFFGVLQAWWVAVNTLYQIWMMRWLGRSVYRSLSANATYSTFCRGLTFTYFALTLRWFASDWKQIGALVAAAGALARALGMADGGVGVQAVARLVKSHYSHTAWLTGLCVVTVVILAVLNAPRRR